MTRTLLVAVDSGTSVVKAIAFDTHGAQLAVAARPNAYQLLPGGGAEQDMNRSWTDVCAVLRELLADLDNRFPDATVAALAVTAQGDGSWLVDADGEPVGNGWLWLDARGAAIADELKATGAAQAAFAYTGTGLAACQQVPQLLWRDAHTPEHIARAAKSLHPKDFLYLRLTGQLATSPCEGTFTFGDYRTRGYRDEVLAALDIERFERLLPPIVDGTRDSHPLTPRAAEATGLPAGLPVVLGYVDVVCTTLGAGIYGGGSESGVTIIGSTGMHIRLVADTAHVTPSPAMTGYCMAFPVPGHTVQAQSNMASTLNIDWIADVAIEAASMAGATVSRATVLQALNEGVAGARPGAIVYHPFISTAGERGPFTDAFARAGLFGLDQNVRLMDFARGIYEGLCFASRDCYVAIGGAPAQIRVTGGAARSRVLREILSAVLDRPLLASAHEEAGAAGVAMIAAVQQGIFPDMAECAASWIAQKPAGTVTPDPALVGLYDKLFPIYRDAYHAMPALWRQFHAAHALESRNA